MRSQKLDISFSLADLEVKVRRMSLVSGDLLRVKVRRMSLVTGDLLRVKGACQRVLKGLLSTRTVNI